MTNNYQKWINLAILEASRSLGITKKNPPVGCVIVKNNILISSGRTSHTGRPHAEENALNKVVDKNLLQDAQMYLTLEPCAHKSKLGKSCVELITETGISEVFICCVDPDPRTNGNAIDYLKKNGIKVYDLFFERDAHDLYRGFFSRIKKNKPFVTLKIACSLDGKIALNNKKSKWITNELSRRASHLLRAQNDAILTSSSTIISDNPLLNCRLEGMEKRSPNIIILDRYLKINKNYKIFQNNFKNKIYIYSVDDSYNGSDKTKNLSTIIVNKNLNNKDYFNFIFSDLASKGINNLLIEVGAKLSTILLSLNLIDNLIIYRSGKIIGNDGLPMIDNLNIHSMNNVENYKLSYLRTFDDDVLEIRKLNN